MASARASWSSQFSWVIGVPAGVNHPSSSASAPVRNLRRRNTGCDSRNLTRFLVYSSSSVSVFDQSSQEITLSWQYALLFPCWLLPSSSPLSIIGTPNDSMSVVSIARDWRARSASTSGSVVSPSAPQFQERLSTAPSMLASAFPSLCLPLYDTRSRSVKPSWAVMKFTDAVGLRRLFPLPPYKSDEPANLVANSPSPMCWLRQ